MMRAARLLMLSLAASLSFPSCGAAGTPAARSQPTTDDPAAERAFKSARELFDAGRLDEADAAFAAFAHDFRRDPLYGGAVVFRARIAIAGGAPKRALELCAELEAASKDPLTLERARLYEGIAASAVGEHERALRLLAPFAGSLTDPAENRLLLSHLWRSAAARGDLTRALRWMDAFLAAEPKEDEAADARRSLDALLAGVQTADDLSAAAAALDPKGAVWPRVMGAVAHARYAAGDLSGASSALAEIDARGRQEDAGAGDIAALVEKRSRVDLAAIGCVLPLSGRARAVGEAALRGVMLAAKAGRLADGRQFSIIVRDTEGDPERAAAAVEDLAVNAGVAAIIGPLDGAEAEAVSKRAEAVQVPVILLAPKGDLRAGRALRIFPSPRAEVDALVDAAVETGAKKHAILFPDTAYGAALRDLYASALGRFGLAPEALVSYPDATADFTPFAKQLTGRGIEIVFVPDTASRIALAAPALAAAGVLTAFPSNGGARSAGAALAATSAGFSPDLVRRAGRYLQGALFAAHFAEGATASAADFARRYRNEYNGEPSLYATYGHDAVALVEWAIENGAASRAAIEAALRNASAESVSAAPLAGRFAGFNSDGAPAAGPYVLTLVGEEWKVAR
jgi:branched-chain amino acid transport system substrate-binding protein